MFSLLVPPKVPKKRPHRPLRTQLHDSFHAPARTPGFYDYAGADRPAIADRGFPLALLQPPSRRICGHAACDVSIRFAFSQTVPETVS
jgi:hypothetical protein